MTSLLGTSRLLNVQPRRDHGKMELTAAEQRVTALLAQGLSNKEIAARLCVSPNTVRTHVSHVLAKLGVRNRAQVVLVMVQRDLIVGESA